MLFDGILNSAAASVKMVSIRSCRRYMIPLLYLLVNKPDLALWTILQWSFPSLQFIANKAIATSELERIEDIVTAIVEAQIGFIPSKIVD